MRIVAAMLLCLLASPLVADMGPKPRTTAPGPVPEKDLEGIEVEMSSEEVSLVLSQGEDGADFLDVEVKFHMTNHGGDTSFEVGFPIGSHDTFDTFTASTDGIEHEHKLIDRNPPKEEEKKDEFGFGHPHDYWYVWQAEYKAGVKVTHVVKYRHQIWHHSHTRSTGYILHTGAAWKNKIGKAVVTLTFGEGMEAGHMRDLAPRGNIEMSDVDGKRVFTWTFKDLEPRREDNISIRYDRTETFDEEVKSLEGEKARYWSSRVALASTWQDAPRREGRDDHNATELEKYRDAVSGLLDELEEDGDKLVMPATQPTKIEWGNAELPEEVRKKMEEEFGDEDRNYAGRWGSARHLMTWFGAAVKIAEKMPNDATAKENLAKWARVAKAFKAGNLYAGSKPLSFSDDSERLMADLDANLDKSEALLAKAK
ncbi:MAG: hypothetical protein K8I27_04185 [Planctomycetes bacterium]|nr:hypothetical protein [Planctomycetota bacterium]